MDEPSPPPLVRHLEGSAASRCPPPSHPHVGALVRSCVVVHVCRTIIEALQTDGEMDGPTEPIPCSATASTILVPHVGPPRGGRERERERERDGTRKKKRRKKEEKKERKKKCPPSLLTGETALRGIYPPSPTDEAVGARSGPGPGPCLPPFYIDIYIHHFPRSRMWSGEKVRSHRRIGQFG